jgi:hypothetical protein
MLAYSTGEAANSQGLKPLEEEQLSPERQRRDGFFSAFFGLKGRFCQPRPKAWVAGKDSDHGPERAIQCAASPK